MRKLLPFLRHLMGLRDAHALLHSEHVQSLATQLGQRIDLSAAQLEKLKFAAEIHDIGKVAVNDFLLSKPGRFTEAEHLMIQQHTVIGARMIKAMPIDGDLISQIILHHHENFDGSGYPDKIKGEEIPLEARILRITDTYDALTTNRGYRAAYSHREAVGIMESEHTFFDPNLLNSFFEMIPGK
jgi:HD-GYP domain-containing protein (c-di-GMP phosphodiesterase class II)